MLTEKRLLINLETENCLESVADVTADFSPAQLGFTTFSVNE
jgi:hypothetical protein